MVSMVSSDAFGGFTFATFSTKKISVVVGVMISSSLVESFYNDKYSPMYKISSSSYR